MNVERKNSFLIANAPLLETMLMVGTRKSNLLAFGGTGQAWTGLAKEVVRGHSPLPQL